MFSVYKDNSWVDSENPDLGTALALFKPTALTVEKKNPTFMNVHLLPAASCASEAWE